MSLLEACRNQRHDHNAVKTGKTMVSLLKFFPCFVNV